MSQKDWQYGGAVDGEPAKVSQTGDRVEGLWGGSPQPDEGQYGHIVSNDGLNASYVREPNGYVVADDAQQDPYRGYYNS